MDVHGDMHSGDLVHALRRADRIVVLTGAGASAESGIPTFRDSLTGLWSRFDPAALATPEAFRDDPALVWGWYEWRRVLMGRCAPNPGHTAIARMQQVLRERGGALDVVTQNVDDLHERAGARGVIHLHGDVGSSRCADCGARRSADDPAGEVPEGGRRAEPPRCHVCGGHLRPEVVWFGESLPGGAWSRATTAARSADVLFSVGTSSTVYPAASLPRFALEAGARVVQVNPEPTGLETIVDDDLRGPAGKVLPALVEDVFGTDG